MHFVLYSLLPLLSSRSARKSRQRLSLPPLLGTMKMTVIPYTSLDEEEGLPRRDELLTLFFLRSGSASAEDVKGFVSIRAIL